jgi:hypothetical protein
MPENTKYTVEFTEAEAYSLLECLTELRKKYVDEYSRISNGTPPLHQPIFVVACELQHKIASAINPDVTTTVEQYLDYGKVK